MDSNQKHSLNNMQFVLASKHLQGTQRGVACRKFQDRTGKATRDASIDFKTHKGTRSTIMRGHHTRSSHAVTRKER